jgi:prepilin-type N-terminal cleavage/methylation domain-containing protein
MEIGGHMLKNNQKAFTLTEMIITIAISGIFFALISSIMIGLLSSYRNFEEDASRKREIRQVWVLILEAVEEANKNGSKLMIREEDGDLLITIGVEQDHFLEYNKDQNLLISGNRSLSLVYIEAMQVDVLNLGSITIAFIDDSGNKDSRVFNLYGGVIIL